MLRGCSTQSLDERGGPGTWPGAKTHGRREWPQRAAVAPPGAPAPTMIAMVLHLAASALLFVALGLVIAAVFDG